VSKLLNRTAWVIWLACLSLSILADSPGCYGAQFGSGHKSKAEIARMSSEQRVEEHCREYVRHGLVDLEYGDLLESYLYHDRLSAIPCLANIIKQYNPSRPEARGKELGQRAYACTTLLQRIDANVVRLRASDEGRKAIEAMRELLDRMRAAHFDTSESYDQRITCEILVDGLRKIEVLNGCDEAIRNSLRLRYDISLSDKELLDLTDHMISQDPYYPSWSEREEYKDLTRRNEAGNPLWYVVMKKPEPYYTAYLQYKAKGAR